MNSIVCIEHVVERLVVLGTPDESMAQRISVSLENSGQACRVAVAPALIKMYEELRSRTPVVMLLDDRILGGASLEEALLRLTEFAPVALIAGPERCEEAGRWVARGDVDFISRAGDFPPLAAAILRRRIRWAEQSESIAGAPWKEFPADMAAILRHEINNPLTGILGNAELLLTHYRDKLPAAAVQRVETVVHLAVRLREATRRFTNALESERQSVPMA